jgi:hypothetical protein
MQDRTAVRNAENPVDLGIDLLLAHQHFATDLVALGLSIIVVVLVGSLGVGLAKFVAWLAAPLLHHQCQRLLIVRCRPTLRISSNLYPQLRTRRL